MARYSPLRSSPALGHRGQTLRPSPGLAKPLWYPTGATHDQDCFRQAEISGLRGARDLANEHEVSGLLADDRDVSLAG